MQIKKKIGILTSSRADYGIYQPLLKKLAVNPNFEVHVLAFGMHLLESHGLTINEIEKDNFGQIHRIKGMPEGDSLYEIAEGYGKVVASFAKFWAQNKFDLVLALGDRFEMSAAVQASIPFEVRMAHLHGGETTLGATDNIYRHQITLASDIHFVAAEPFKKRVEQLIDSTEKIYNVGSLSLDGIENLALPEWKVVREHFNFPEKPFVLITVHPETVSNKNNTHYAKELKKALAKICKSIHLVITMTNADAMGSLYRNQILKLKEENPDQISLVENFGKLNYFAAMKACKLMFGNTSSGIIEAASFNKYVINVGDRQKGRLRNANVIDVEFDAEKMIKEVEAGLLLPPYIGGNLFSKPDTAINIIKRIENA